MEIVQFNSQNFATGATGTSTHYVGYYDCIMVHISAVSSIFASSAVNITLRGAHNSFATAKTAYWYDYSNKVPTECTITAATQGVYEIPFTGAIPYVNLGFSTATAGSGTIYVAYGKAN